MRVKTCTEEASCVANQFLVAFSGNCPPTCIGIPHEKADEMMIVMVGMIVMVEMMVMMMMIVMVEMMVMMEMVVVVEMRATCKGHGAQWPL